MSIEIFINGQFFPKEEAKISVFDHGFLYGDGVFEGIRAYNGRVFQFEEHIDRLYDSAKVIALEIPLNKEEMKQAHLETLRRNHLKDAYIRTIVSRGIGDLGLDPRKCPRPSIIIIADQVGIYPDDLYEKGLRVVTVPTRRNVTEALNPMIKSLNYLNSIMAKIEANLAGVPEAIMLNQEGFVAECTGDNIFVIHDKTIITPAASYGALRGITRKVIVELIKKTDLTVIEGALTRYDIFVADECFLTGTAIEVIPVVEVDGRLIADGKPGFYTQSIKQAFQKLTETSGRPIYE